MLIKRAAVSLLPLGLASLPTGLSWALQLLFRVMGVCLSHSISSPDAGSGNFKKYITCGANGPFWHSEERSMQAAKPTSKELEVRPLLAARVLFLD